MSFEADLKASLKRLIQAGQGILIAVSGGRDSMALLHGLAHLQPSLEIPKLLVAHLNHGLRGEFGQRDADFVTTACDTLQVPVVVSECRAGELRESSRGSLEESARNARYEFLRTLAMENNLPLIATAHHARDQAETVLHNILRGTGIRGLSGIPERRQLNNNVELIRPLLTIRAASIEEYVHAQGIAFSVDETNIDNKFTRNRIRHELMPLLQSEFNAQIADSLVRLADQSRELLEGMDALANSLLTLAILEQTPDICRVDLQKLQSQPEPIIRHALTVLWIRQNWPRRDIGRTQLQRLTAMLTSGHPSAMDLPGSVRAELRGSLLILQAVRPPR